MSDCQKKERVRWTAQEQQMFTKLFKQHRIDFKKYLPFFESRTESQLRSYYHNVLHNNKLIKNSSNQISPQISTHASPLVSFNESVKCNVQKDQVTIAPKSEEISSVDCLFQL
ncbi:SANT/Myb_domain [Hexamita inflata]|uniref:SANT/Myb domain n=1 Tax=Hexamita inflata TaxID=28002 RepID=A0AA86Q8Y4_9EUKA|nr:SANT/Myb domain [Hexamita inflata]